MSLLNPKSALDKHTKFLMLSDKRKVRSITKNLPGSRNGEVFHFCIALKSLLTKLDGCFKSLREMSCNKNIINEKFHPGLVIHLFAVFVKRNKFLIVYG